MVKKVESLEDLCVNQEIAVSQITSELKKYLSDKGCEGFKIMGCYSCDGYESSCPAYLPKKEVGL